MRDSYGFVLDITWRSREARKPGTTRRTSRHKELRKMFHCERCGIRFSTGALSGRRDCPRCKSRDGVTVLLTWEPVLAARTEAALAEARPRRERLTVATRI
jgi:hypothetical protein